MHKSSPQSPVRRASLILLAGVALGIVWACARPTTTSQAEPEVVIPKDSSKASDLTAREVQKDPHESIANVLQARTPGAEVSVGPDGSISVRIRGAASFYGGTEPLYIVDGSPVTPAPGGVLRGINPYDIESIEVLKGPPETTLYGVRGANGVILIKTKRPPR
jgi:TonB-dependent SusC/RagA subfamily outer membrane receptor